MKRILLILAVACIMVAGTVVMASADSGSGVQYIQPCQVNPGESYGPDNPNINNMPVAPKDRWFGFTMNSGEKGCDYIYKFTATKKAGYKLLFDGKVEQRQDSSKKVDGWLSVCSAHDSEAISIFTFFGTYPESDSQWHNKAYLKPGEGYWIIVHRYWNLNGADEADVKLRIREVPMNPTKGRISSVKAKKKGFTVKLAKSKYATKYAVAYKTGKGKWRYAYTTKLSKSVSKLRKGKKYTVKVRAIRVVDGRKYYGAWSEAKKVKVN